MADLLEYIGTWSILKWIVLVLIAGFIGQFGKMAANTIAAKIRVRRQKQENIPDARIKPTIPEAPLTPTTTAPPDKKLIKAMAKAKKKEAKKAGYKS
jgi:hypothetical protein